MSVMEMSHRSAAFKGIIEEAEADLRDLGEHSRQLQGAVLAGGATQQFAAIPMNLMLNGKQIISFPVRGPRRRLRKLSCL